MKKLKNKNEELREIFANLKDKDKNAYNILYKEYYSLIYGIVFSILKNKENTEDVLQEIFIKLYNLDKEKFPIKGELSWLYTVSKNEAFNYLRRKKQEVNIEDIYEISEESSQIENLIDIHTYNKIISGLNAEEKQIVSLKILSNFTFKKIGQMLSMPTATVQWKYYKAVNSLKISLGSFASFIITFILFALRRENVKSIGSKSEIKKENFSESTDKVVEDMESSESLEKNENSEITSDNNHNLIINVPSGTTNTVASKEQESIDIIQPVLIGFSGIFLIISIIFAIFFKNHQQKSKKKASK